MKTNSTLSGSGTLLNISSKCSRDVLPATLTSGLGLLQVCGRIRVPQPAIGMNIFRVSLMVQFYRVNAQGRPSGRPWRLQLGMSENRVRQISCLQSFDFLLGKLDVQGRNGLI